MPHRTVLSYIPTFWLLSFGLLLGGCGYQLGQGESIAMHYRTIGVPYIEGDMDGSLTAAVVKAIAQSGTLEYRHCGGALTLLVKEVAVEEENIGFRYYRKKKGSLTHDIVPTETRTTVVVDVTVVETASQRIVLGPVQISASVDFDHDFYSSRDGINIFSLGQLIDIDSAYDAVESPLQQKLAQKIVDYVSQSW